MKVVLAYSGGLDTSVILAWLREERGADVIAYTADVGQGAEAGEAKEKALATGATEAVVEDLTHRFVTGAVFPALRAGAVYEGHYLLGTSLAAPDHQRGSGPNRPSLRSRCNLPRRHREGQRSGPIRAIGGGAGPRVASDRPLARVGSRWAGGSDGVRPERGIPVPVTKEDPYSMDANLYHISYEGGVLEDPWSPPPPKMFRLTVDPTDAPDQPEEVVIGFDHGDPVSIDGREMGPVELLKEANEKAGRHGIGRVDIVENRFVGIKSRGVYETPGGTILHLAHRAVESITLDREVVHIRDGLIPRYAQIVYNGFWFSPERNALQGLIDDIQAPVTGEARLILYKGGASVTGRRAPNSLYDPGSATFEADDVYRQADAEGFISLNALRIRGFGGGEVE